jgi:hypothetical protein
MSSKSKKEDYVWSGKKTNNPGNPQEYERH